MPIVVSAVLARQGISMTIDTLIAFIIASAVITLIPGPCVLLLIGQSLSKGFRTAFASIGGILIGDIFLMILSLLGVGAIMSASPVLFQIIKWAGVFYMAYLGYLAIADGRKPISNLSNGAYSSEIFKSFKAEFLSAALNPKGIMFYMAFLSQFIDQNANILIQINILILTSTIVVGLILAIYVILSVKAKILLQGSNAKKKIGYVGGGSLIAASIFTAVAR